MNITNCPICNSEVKAVGSTILCKCGWSKSFNQTIYKKIQNKIVKGMVIIGIVFMGSLTFVDTWGSDSLKIIPLKIQQWTQSLDKKSFKELKHILISVKKYNQLEQVYTSFYNSSKDLNILSELGVFQYKRDKLTNASKTFHQYFTQKGDSVKAAYYYARILEKTGQTKFALSYYKYALTMQPKVIQVSIMNDYINLLIKAKYFNTAKKALRNFKPLLKQSNMFVKQEYKRWTQKVIKRRS